MGSSPLHQQYRPQSLSRKNNHSFLCLIESVGFRESRTGSNSFFSLTLGFGGNLSQGSLLPLPKNREMAVVVSLTRLSPGLNISCSVFGSGTPNGSNCRSYRLLI